MKINILFISLVVLAMSFSACDQDIDGYDAESAYIYFNMPFIIDNLGRTTINRQDSLYYSFGLDDISIQDAIIEVPLKIIGVAVDHDREFMVEVVPEATTATDEDWDTASINSGVVPKGEQDGKLFVKVKRSEATKTAWKQIVFRVVPNENFDVGFSNLITTKVTFSSILPPPEWWSNWQKFLGTFYREVFVKWQEIYYLGADPNVNKYGDGPGMGELLYWDNMPSFANHNWFPSTFLFISVLKQYFIDNEVYPDNDTSQPRILLP